MARICVGCGNALRIDESEVFIQEAALDGSTRSYHGCTNCFRRVNGLPAIPPPVYQDDSTLLPGSYICGICRKMFSPEEVSSSLIRLAPADAPGEKTAHGKPIVPDGQPGAQYLVCDPCKQRYRARIAARLVRTNESFQRTVLRQNRIEGREQDTIIAGVPGDWIQDNGLDFYSLADGNWLQ